MTVRFATPEDSGALLAIYAQYIHTPITFECELPSEGEFTQRVAEICRGYPYLVAEEEGRIVGYAYAHTLRERIAYQWTAELSIYLDQSARGRGIGKALYQRLLALLALQGVRTVYGCVTAPNPASEALHGGLGFRLCGTFHKSGYKSGQWWDVLWLEKDIGDHQTAPQPLVPFPQVDRESVRRVLDGFRHI